MLHVLVPAPRLLASRRLPPWWPLSALPVHVAASASGDLACTGKRAHDQRHSEAPGYACLSSCPSPLHHLSYRYLMQGALTLLHCASCGTISSSSPAASRRARQAKWTRLGKMGGLASSWCPETTMWSRESRSERGLFTLDYIHCVLWQTPELCCVFENCTVLQPNLCQHQSPTGLPTGSSASGMSDKKNYNARTLLRFAAGMTPAARHSSRE